MIDVWSNGGVPSVVLKIVPFGISGETRTAGTRTPKRCEVESGGSDNIIRRYRPGGRGYVVEVAAVFVVGQDKQSLRPGRAFS